MVLQYLQDNHDGTYSGYLLVFCDHRLFGEWFGICSSAKRTGAVKPAIIHGLLATKVALEFRPVVPKSGLYSHVGILRSASLLCLAMVEPVLTRRTFFTSTNFLVFNKAAAGKCAPFFRAEAQKSPPGKVRSTGFRVLGGDTTPE